MKKLPIAASLVLAYFAYTCANPAQASGISFSASSASAPQTSSSPAPGSSATTPAKSTSKKHSSSKKHRSARREPTQKAPTPDRISEIQTALARGGYYQGSPNGKWDSNTVAAMQKFQSDNNLTANGKINASSLQKLGLGSATAGVDAPKPAQPPLSSAASPATTSSGLAPAANTSTASTASPAPNSSSATKTPHL
jgi:peptidoglycan hydrolase-like protein with peptidoglycan-binding domain